MIEKTEQAQDVVEPVFLRPVYLSCVEIMMQVVGSEEAKGPF